MLRNPLPAEVAEAQVCRARRMEILGLLTGGMYLPRATGAVR